MFDLAIHNHVAQLTLDRPEAHNAIGFAGWAELTTLARRAAADNARALVICGTPGGAFCSGADLRGFARFHDDPDACTAFRLAMRDALDALRDLAIPTIALVEGVCYGAGVAIAMACDLRFASFSARFAITPARLGIGYPQDDIHRLVTLVGPGEAARLLLGAQPIDGREARRIRLVEVAVEANIAYALDDFLASVAETDPDSLAMLKRGIALAARGIARDENQDRRFDALLGSDAMAERLARHETRAR